MHITAASLEDLVEKQREYGSVLLEQCRYNKILTGCSNQVMAGYLYIKYVEYEKNGMLVEYKIHADQAECGLALHELIELLGILLTNAKESRTENGEEQKSIELVVEESVTNLVPGNFSQ